MTRALLTWALALGVSAAAHGLGAYGLFLATRPNEMPDQPVPETELQLAAYQVQRTEARETAPESDRATTTDTGGATVDQRQIAQSRAAPQRPPSVSSAALQPSDTPIAPTTPDGTAAPALADPVETIGAKAVPQTTTRAQALRSDPQPSVAIQPAETALQVTPPAPSLPTASLASDAKAVTVAALPPAASRADALVPATEARTGIALRPEPPAASDVPAAVEVAAVRPAVTRADPARIAASSVPQMQMPQPAAQEAAPEMRKASPRPVAATAAPPVTPPADRSRATLAFEGSDGGTVDTVSLAAFQSFMEPGDLSAAAAEVRDGITGALSAVPCSRLQVAFDPDETALLVSGHVPEAALRRDVVAAMQARMGDDIAVRDNLLILPRPQCDALTGIANVGLPQSTDQITNPLLLGEDTHAREFSYTAGSPLVMALQGADYDAYVYVDYFDADGNVLHLVPNDFTPLDLTRAEAAFQIGSDAPLSPGEPGLYIEIGPPFGQEIAVAFAASHPLYEGVRPLVEPAAPYLAWLQDRVAEARVAHPDFKGEWVYFFVSTSPD